MNFRRNTAGDEISPSRTSNETDHTARHIFATVQNASVSSQDSSHSMSPERHEETDFGSTAEISSPITQQNIWNGATPKGALISVAKKQKPKIDRAAPTTLSQSNIPESLNTYSSQVKEVVSDHIPHKVDAKDTHVVPVMLPPSNTTAKSVWHSQETQKLKSGHDLWNDVVKTASKELRLDELTRISEIGDYDKFSRSLEAKARKFGRSTTLTRIITKLNPALEYLKSFSCAINVMVQANPTISCLIWGSLTIVIEVCNSSKYPSNCLSIKYI